MRSFAALHEDDADAHATNALLLVVNAIGIPVLTREYGEAHTPPSAAVGILSALFHASAKGGESPHLLHALESEHRKIVYHVTKQELLLLFVCDKQQRERITLSNRMTTRMLETVSAAVSMLLSSQSLENLDAPKQRLALSKHTEMIDYIVKNFRKDARLLLGRPLRHVRIEQVKSIASSKLQQGVWLRDGLVVAEYRQHRAVNSCKLDAIEIVVLIILSECLVSRGLHSAREIVRISCASSSGGVIAKLTIETSESSGTTRIGIFSEDVSEHELREEESKLLTSAHFEEDGKTPVNSSPSPPIALLKRLSTTFICFLNPNWKSVWTESIQQTEKNSSVVDKETANGISENFVWKTLCEFVALRLDSLPRASGASQPLDYKQEDEVFSFLHHMRDPLQFFSVCMGSTPLQQIPAIGDALYQHFSTSQ